MKIVIDRIEGDQVICETSERRMLTLPLSLFPHSIQEGDILRYEDDRITADPDSTKLRKTEMENRFWKLVKRKK